MLMGIASTAISAAVAFNVKEILRSKDELSWDVKGLVDYVNIEAQQRRRDSKIVVRLKAVQMLLKRMEIMMKSLYVIMICS